MTFFIPNANPLLRIIQRTLEPRPPSLYGVLAQLPSREAVDFFRRVLEGQDIESRRRAIYGLRVAAGRWAAPFLALLLDDAEWLDTREVVFDTNEDGTFVAIPGLLLLLWMLKHLPMTKQIGEDR